MHDIKKKLEILKIKDYRKIIETIDAKVDRFTNIKKACEKADIPYRLYYTARSFLAKYDKPVEIQKVFKNKQHYSLSKEEIEKKKKDDIIELMHAIGGSNKKDENILDDLNVIKLQKDNKVEKSSDKNIKNVQIIKKEKKEQKGINEERTEKSEKKNNGVTSIYNILGPKHTNFS
jgi:hypothetical protein